MSKTEGDRWEASESSSTKDRGEGTGGAQERRSSSSRDLTLYLFGRTGREKEAWFQRFLSASKLKVDSKKASSVAVTKSGEDSWCLCPKDISPLLHLFSRLKCKQQKPWVHHLIPHHALMFTVAHSSELSQSQKQSQQSGWDTGISAQVKGLLGLRNNSRQCQIQAAIGLQCIHGLHTAKTRVSQP